MTALPVDATPSAYATTVLPEPRTGQLAEVTDLDAAREMRRSLSIRRREARQAMVVRELLERRPELAGVCPAADLSVSAWVSSV